MYNEIINFAKEKNLEPISNRKNSTIAGYIQLGPDGEYENIVNVDKKKRKYVSVPDFGTKSATSKQANPIIEKIGYILGNDDKPLKHKSFVNDIASGAEWCRSINVIHKFITLYEEDEEFHQSVLEDFNDSGLKKDEIVSWMIDGECIENMEYDWNDWLVDRVNKFEKKETKTIISSFSGNKQESIPSEGAPAICNVTKEAKAAFGIGRKCYVASAKEKAYQSYGFEGAAGAQIGIIDANLLVSGIEYLLNHSEHHDKNFKQLFFINNNVENIIKESLDGIDETIPKTEQSDSGLIRKIISAADSGIHPILPNNMKTAHYYMCKFEVPSDGRFFITNEDKGTCEDLVDGLYAWYRDTSLYHKGSVQHITKAFSVLVSCVNNQNDEFSKKEKAAHDEFNSLKGPLLHAIYHNTQIPAIFYRRSVFFAAKTFLKKNDDQKVNSTPVNIRKIYAQIIKCYLVRKGWNFMPEVTNNINAAYACGKLFATFEQIQYKYYRVQKRTLNRNLAQIYFHGAMNHPGMIFSVLSDQNVTYINGLEKSDYVYYSRLLGKITNEIATIIPNKFNEDEQGSFILGYYQQKADFMKKSSCTYETNNSLETNVISEKE